VDADLESAISASHLRDLPADVIDDLMVGAVRRKIPASLVIHREGEGAPLLELVVSGIVRGFVTAPDGRTMTVRYCRPGALLGVMSLFIPGFAMRGSVQALVDAELLALSPGVASRAAERDVRVTLAFLHEQSERAFGFLYEVPGSAFATVRQRVARHLLDLASEGAPAPELVVSVSQQQLAEAVGTVREVIVRVLRELRAAGVLRTERNRIVILDPARLIAEQDWNLGP
jgi:CRP/FNR family transcriptional regulator, cyclic AMP receptor protein